MTSISRQLTRSALLVTALASLLVFSSAMLFIRARLVAQFDQALQTTAETIGSLIEVDRGTIELDERDESLTEFHRSSRPSLFEIRGSDGSTLFRSKLLETTLNVASKRNDISKAMTLPDGRPGRAHLLRVTPHQEHDDDEPAPSAPAEPVLLVVARDTLDLNSTINSTAIGLGLTLLALCASMLMLVPRLVRRALAPLEGMSDQAANLGTNSLINPFPTESIPKELVPISRQLNASLDRLREAFVREQQFASNAAHELRTPLAAVRASAEVALKWPDSAEASLRDILTASVRMQSLVDRLLQLTRGRATVRCLPLCLRDSVVAAIARLPQSDGPIDFQLTIASDQSINTDPEVFGYLIDNLLQNAVVHRSPDSPVQIDTPPSPSPVKIHMRISNRALDLSETELATMFDPLWTKSTSRTTHMGLGLALAQSYATALDLTLKPSLSGDGLFSIAIAEDASTPRGGL